MALPSSKKAPPLSGGASQGTVPLPSGWAAAAAIFALHLEMPRRTNVPVVGWGCEGTAMRKTPRKLQVAVIATSDGRFTFQIFLVSSVPKTVKTSGQCYLTPADAAQAGYDMISSTRM